MLGSKIVNIKYVTDLLLVPGLRCPHCKGKVRQIRNSPSERGMVAASLIEPLVWAIFGIAAFVGYLWETVFGLALVLIVAGPFAGIWLYIRGVRQGDFLCPACGVQLSYAQVACRK
jgi:hypothetical protein